MSVEMPEDEHVDGPYYAEVPGACLTYFKEEDGWLIDEIRSKTPGGGKATVREFIKRVGRDQLVHINSVVEKQTLDRLRELGLLKLVDETKIPIDIIEPETIWSLKLARVLIGGGVAVDRVSVVPIEEKHRKEFEGDCCVNVSMYGTT